MKKGGGNLALSFYRVTDYTAPMGDMSRADRMPSLTLHRLYGEPLCKRN